MTVKVQKKQSSLFIIRLPTSKVMGHQDKTDISKSEMSKFYMFQSVCWLFLCLNLCVGCFYV